MSNEIHNIWERELCLEQFSDDEDFFLLGGHSLIMQKIQVRIMDEIGIEVPMDELFRRPTVVQISEYVESAMALS